MHLNKEERTLLLLYHEESREDTINNLKKMRSELKPDESELLMLTDEVIRKLEEVSDEAFLQLDLFETG